MIIGLSQFFAIFGGQPEEPPKTSLIGPDDLGILLSLIRTFRCRRVIEFGVGTGANAQAILGGCDWIETYLGIDVPPDAIPTLAFQRVEVPKDAGWLARGDRRFELWVQRGGSQGIQPGRLVGFDFAFIDGDHSAAAVRHDTTLARAAINRGVICWHDYRRQLPDGPRVVIDELNASDGDHICLVEPTSMCFRILG
jgi:predicted O-methyltransferase YrrM